MTAPRIVVVGSVNIDLTLRLPAWARPGETITADGLQIGLGGKGANQAVAAARLGADVRLIAAVGRDAFGEDARARLLAEGLTIALAEPDGLPTGLALIDVTPDGQNMIRVAAGANVALDALHVRGQQHLFEGAAVVLLQNEVPFAASIEAARLGRAAGAVVIMDPGPAPSPVWTAAEITWFDFLTPNAHEVAAFLDTEPATLAEAERCAVRLCEDGLNSAIVTMGSAGVAWASARSVGTRTATLVNAIDTVAAGDCFNGALAVSLGEGHGLAEAIAFAADAAALAACRPGAAGSTPTRAELWRFRSAAA